MAFYNITLQKKHLEAMRLACTPSRYGLRPSIEGVFFEFRGNQHIMIATNGHIMLGCGDVIKSKPWGALLAIEHVDTVLKLCRHNELLNINYNSKYGIFKIHVCGQDLIFRKSSQTYPDWRKVVPIVESKDISTSGWHGFDTNYLNVFKKIRERLGCAGESKYLKWLIIDDRWIFDVPKPFFLVGMALRKDECTIHPIMQPSKPVSKRISH